ncbi:MAG: RimJ/RimL family protein N-acetyltransferase, partial [Candidatus Sericytochromatia bacterium]|nr:RimJ/RimL family protein N-acetyltransferase [Candidatus Sericytochromatia bacterium]
MFVHPLDAETHLALLEWPHAEALFALVDANRARLRTWLGWVDRTQTVR